MERNNNNNNNTKNNCEYIKNEQIHSFSWAQFKYFKLS